MSFVVAALIFQAHVSYGMANTLSFTVLPYDGWSICNSLMIKEYAYHYPIPCILGKVYSRYEIYQNIILFHILFKNVYRKDMFVCQ